MPSNVSLMYSMRTLKGAPVSIIFTFLVINKPLSVNWLKFATGYREDELLPALMMLRDLGVVIELPDGRWTERYEEFADDCPFDLDLFSVN